MTICLCCRSVYGKPDDAGYLPKCEACKGLEPVKCGACGQPLPPKDWPEVQERAVNRAVQAARVQAKKRARRALLRSAAQARVSRSRRGK